MEYTNKLITDEVSGSKIRDFFGIGLRSNTNLRDLLEREWLPSRIAIFVQLALLDKDLNGTLKFEEISDNNEIIKALRKSVKDYLNTVSLLSALFTLSMLNVITQNVPIGEPSRLIDDAISHTNAQTLLTTYIVLASFGCVCELITTVLCVLWYIKATAHTPIPEDFIWFILQHNAAIPFFALVLGLVSIVFALACLIFLNYGFRIGVAACVVCGIPLGMLLIHFLWSEYDLYVGLRKRAKHICNMYDAELAKKSAQPSSDPPTGPAAAAGGRRSCWVGQ